jgi:hypothetical protein
MSSKQGKLSDPQLAAKLSGVVGANTVIEQYVQSVIEQKDIKLAALENLPAHQRLARSHAQYYRSEIKPDVQQCVTDTIQFSKAFLGKCDTLKTLINKLKNGDQKAKTEFTTVITSLKDNLVSTVLSHSKEVAAKFGKFDSMVDQDMRNFTQDSEEAQTKIIGTNGELQAMQNHLEAINKAIARDQGLIAGGIFTIWLAVAGGVDLHKQEEAKHDENMKIAIKKQELRALNAVKSQIDGFLNAMKPATITASSLEEAWLSLTSDFQEVVEELEDVSSTSAADYLEPLLEAAKKDWMYALGRAEQLNK